MERLCAAAVRTLCAALAGAQIFFAGIAAQVVFPREVAQLPHSDPRRVLAADLVGGMLARLDAATLAGCALAVLCALVARRARIAVLPVIAALCALASAVFITPSIHALREAGQTALPRFGALHAASSSLLLLEVILLVVTAVRAD